MSSPLFLGAFGGTVSNQHRDNLPSYPKPKIFVKGGDNFLPTVYFAHLWRLVASCHRNGVGWHLKLGLIRVNPLKQTGG